jgi:uncharacterized protein YjbI with pentapeptide repeats
MARAKKSDAKECDEPSCLHVIAPRLDPRRPILAAFGDEDDEPVDLEGARVVSATLAPSGPRRFSLSDCALERCDLANATLRGAQLTRVSLVDCRLVGVELTEESFFEDVTFTRCTLEMATFEAATLRRVVFEQCVLEGASFAGSRLERVAFPGSKLARCDLSSAQAPKGAGSIDLRGALLAGAALDARLLRALVVTPDAAPSLLAALGTAVREGEPRVRC